MPKCPKCGAEISYLNERREYSDIYLYRFEIYDNDGDYDSTFIENEGTDDEPINIEYYCPKCNGYLFGNIEDAVDFLSGKSEI